MKIRLFFIGDDTEVWKFDVVPRLGEEIVNPDTGFCYQVVRVIHYPKANEKIQLHLIRL